MAGNHDYMQMNSYYRTCEFPENVFFFSREEVTGFDFPEENVTGLWAQLLAQGDYGQTLRCAAPGEPRADQCAAGAWRRWKTYSVFHGNNPAKWVRLYCSGAYPQRWSARTGACVMAGALEPTDCNDFGPHGYWLGELEKGRSSVSFFPVKKCEYCKETVRVTPETTGYGLQEQIRALVEESPKYRYFQIEMEGRVDPDVWFNLEQIAALDRITGVVESFTPDYSYEKICAEQEEHCWKPTYGAWKSTR